MNRQWIRSRDRLSSKYRKGIKSYIACHHVNKNNQIPCPCRVFHNTFFHLVEDVHFHLLNSCMDMNYDRWIYHGEHIQQVQGESLVSTNNEPISNFNVNMFNMIEDVFERIDDDDDDDDQDTMENQDTMWGGDMTNAWTDVDTYEMLLGEAQKELYLGCKQYTVLTYIKELIHTKVDNHTTNKAIDKMLAMMKKMCLQPNNVLDSFCECKKI